MAKAKSTSSASPPGEPAMPAPGGDLRPAAFEVFDQVPAPETNPAQSGPASRPARARDRNSEEIPAAQKRKRRNLPLDTGAVRPRRRTPRVDAAGNAIEFLKASGARLRESSPHSGPSDKEREPGHVPSRNGSSPAHDGSRDSTQASERPFPAEVREKFVIVGSNVYFPDGTLAFVDHGTKFTTRSENTAVIDSIIATALERGAKAIKVSGTERFRQAAWFIAQAKGLSVEGHTPTELERGRVTRRATRAADASGNGVREERAADHGQGSTVPGSSKASSPKHSRETGRLIVGTLTNHGPAPYQRQKGAAMNYFVTLETNSGPQEIWGVDLHRALKHSLTRPDIGDEVGLRTVRREAVRVWTPTLDSQGRTTGRERLDTHRNEWIIEKLEFFNQRAADARVVRDPRTDPKQATRDRPHLLGTFLQIAAAKLAAQSLGHPKDQEIFLTSVRKALADSVRRGDPLPPVPMQDKGRPLPAQTRQSSATLEPLIPERS